MMEPHKPVHFDLEKLRNACLDSDELVVKLLRIFLSQSKDWSAKLKLAVEKEDFKAICFISHTIKGGSATLYAKSVIDNAVKLNEFAHSSVSGTDVKMEELVGNIYKSLSDTSLEIETYLQSLTSQGFDK